MVKYNVRKQYYIGAMCSNQQVAAIRWWKVYILFWNIGINIPQTKTI